MTYKPEQVTSFSRLSPNHLGHDWASLETTTSTIDYAQVWLAQGAPHGAVVTAERQTRGRGRQGQTWLSPRGGLWLSVIMYPQLEVSLAGRLGLILALAGAVACEELAGCPIGLKWPNDLMLDGRKLGGVLVDSAIEGRQVSAAILSIGINVNIPPAELPEEIRESATSLVEHLGREIVIPDLAAALLNRLEAFWPELTGSGEALQAAWSQRDILAGREVSVTSAGKQLQGVARGVDGLGRLGLLTSAGEMLLTTGEVTAVREQPS